MDLNCAFQSSRAGLHDNAPHRPSAKVAPVGCPLATMELNIKTVTIPKGGLYGWSCHPIWDVGAVWAELHETGGRSATLAVNRLGDVVNPAPLSPGLYRGVDGWFYVVFYVACSSCSLPSVQHTHPFSLSLDIVRSICVVGCVVYCILYSSVVFSPREIRVAFRGKSSCKRVALPNLM